MNILIIDNNIDRECWGSSDLCRLARLAPQATLFVRRGPQNDLPRTPEKFDRIIVSGSRTSALDEGPWIDQLMNFIRQVVAQKIPYLGVCYGHQVLVRALGGKECVRKAKAGEFGWTQIEIIHPSPLTENLPQKFYTFSSHYDEVSQLPMGMKLLAQSDYCQIQACQLEDLPIFGIQFHPERTPSEAVKVLHQAKARSLNKKDSLHLLNGERSSELYNPKWGETLFENFLRN